MHFSLTSNLHARNGMNNCQIPIKPNAGEKEAPTEDVKLFPHAHQLAEKRAEQPTCRILNQIERECEKEQEVSQGEVQQVDLGDAQEAPASQEDGDHQAVPCHTQQKDQAVEHSLEDGMKGPQVQLLMALVLWLACRIFVVI